MPESPRSWNRRRALTFLAVVAVPAAFVILDCSGLAFPVLGKQSSLTRGLRDDFGLTPPASLTVEHAARIAARDPAYLYACTIDSADIPPFLAALADHAAKHAYNTSDTTDTRFYFGVPSLPAWYNPDSAPDIQQLRVFIPPSSKSGSGYWFFFSSSAHKLWVFWYST